MFWLIECVCDIESRILIRQKEYYAFTTNSQASTTKSPKRAFL